MSSKKEGPKAAEKDRSERWLLSYADFITLLLVFFIVLYSMSNLEVSKFNALSQELSIVFGGIGRSGLLDGGRTAMPGSKVYKAAREMKNTEEKIRRMIAHLGLEGKISTAQEERGLVISVKDSVLFPVGSGELSAPAREIISAVARILSDLPNQIRIEGHTDDIPIHTTTFFSNWELSTARATNVLQYFIQNGHIIPERLSAAGYGEYRPFVPNKDGRTRALNRRVDIVLLSSEFSKFEPGAVHQELLGAEAPGKDSSAYLQTDSLDVLKDKSMTEEEFPADEGADTSDENF